MGLTSPGSSVQIRVPVLAKKKRGASSFLVQTSIVLRHSQINTPSRHKHRRIRSHLQLPHRPRPPHILRSANLHASSFCEVVVSKKWSSGGDEAQWSIDLYHLIDFEYRERWIDQTDRSIDHWTSRMSRTRALTRCPRLLPSRVKILSSTTLAIRTRCRRFLGESPRSPTFPACGCVVTFWASFAACNHLLSLIRSL